MITGTVLIILAVGILFLIVVLQIAAYPKLYLQVSKWLVVITSVSSLLIYGYGFAYVFQDEPLYALVRTLLAVCGTYIGRNEYDAISSAPGFSTWGFQIVFWLLQVVAIYTLFSAVLAALGQDMVKSLRRKWTKRGDLMLIFGSGQHALDFGRDCRKNNRLSVLFVLRRADPSAISIIDEMGAAYRTDASALHPDAAFLRSIHAGKPHRRKTGKPSAGGQTGNSSTGNQTGKPSAGGQAGNPSTGAQTVNPLAGNRTGNSSTGGQTSKPSTCDPSSCPQASGRKIFLYCLDEDPWEDYQYAATLRAAFLQAGVDPQNVTAVLLGREASGMQQGLIGTETTPGFGNASVFNKYSLAARLLIGVCRPWELMSFDTAACKAKEDFRVLLLGFGSYGQSILRELVRNGQFYGSTFHATVIDRNGEQAAGLLRTECHAMFEAYDIQIIPEDVESLLFFKYLQEQGAGLKLIVLALGSQESNRQAADQIRTALDAASWPVPVVSCSDEGILCQRMDAAGVVQEEKYPLFTAAGMDFDKMDQLAMEVNHTYSDDPRSTAEQDWKKCDYFGRMSSRASADYIPAMLRAMGLSQQEAEELFGKDGRLAGRETFTVSKDGTSDPAAGVLSQRQARNLGRMEHERWCAFHYTMGYSPMNWQEWEARAAIYQQQQAAGSTKPIKIGKDTKERRHICILPWETLPELSDRENAVTGGHTDYQQIDINNALAIPRVLGRIHK